MAETSSSVLIAPHTMPSETALEGTTARPAVLFVTGRLAEQALRKVLESVAGAVPFECRVAVAPISVAALMHVDWVLRRVPPPMHVSRVVLPGWCQGELNTLIQAWGVPVERGPKELLDLPDFLLGKRREPPLLQEQGIEILAEINHAPRQSLSQLLQLAEHYRVSGADWIDLGCIPGESWSGVADAVTALRREGHRVSIDSFDRREVTAAVAAGAELVLSVNHSNLDWAQAVPAEFVAIPDQTDDWASLAKVADTMTAAGRTVRWDPILEPVGFGFGASLQRYARVRAERPTVPMMMGVGNVTELSEVDSAGMNFLLAALCEEWQIGSVLTTEVASWCASAVREFDLARRFVRHSLSRRIPAKAMGGGLLLLRDLRWAEQGAEILESLAAQLTDPNFRIFAERGEVHLMNRDGYWHGDDPYDVFDRMLADAGPLTAEHAFYLGTELMKARTALTLGKQYRQDEALKWGFLTRTEQSALERRRHRKGISINRPATPQTTIEPKAADETDTGDRNRQISEPESTAEGPAA
jgi:dihydropteroate synthase